MFTVQLQHFAESLRNRYTDSSPPICRDVTEMWISEVRDDFFILLLLSSIWLIPLI